MWRAGLVAEVRGLAEVGLRDGKTASRALGYAQVLRFLDGEWSQEQAAEQTVKATRRFARRQLSWFRRDPRITWLPAAGTGPGWSCDGYDRIMRFAKGHGTGNDFLILPDPDDAMAPSPDLVARLCDRRTGLGADGILRAVRVPAAGRAAPGGAAGTAEWFMDYRNADGSIAEMCGNGIRVFARYLLGHGLAEGPGVRGGDAGRAAPGPRGAGRRVHRGHGRPLVHGHAVR